MIHIECNFVTVSFLGNSLLLLLLLLLNQKCANSAQGCKLEHVCFTMQLPTRPCQSLAHRKKGISRVYNFEQRTLCKHCAVEVEPGFVFIAGGLPHYTKVFRFDPGTGAFDSLPDLTQKRTEHGCGVVDKGDS